jgi:hypothetical protein
MGIALSTNIFEEEPHQDQSDECEQLGQINDEQHRLVDDVQLEPSGCG